MGCLTPRGRLYVQIDPLIAIDDAGTAVGLFPRNVGAIAHMYMAVQHQFGVIPVQHIPEYRKTAVGQVTHIPVTVQRRMGDQHIQAVVPVDLAPQPVDPLVSFLPR